ncbi:MAG: Uma2 family endonuclease [Armatimonadetes bacterium]|nr:Uma2 family endonuclease [Armatimonadota bacterium]
MLKADSEIKFTYQDYLLMPDDRRYELIEGDLRMVPAPNEAHQRVSKKIEFRLIQSLEEVGSAYVYDAPVDVVFSDETAVQPDILVISKERKNIITKEHIRGAPDLIIEILSPHSLERDRIIKKKLYGKFGVREYWIVDPESQSIEVLVWKQKGLKTWRTFPKGSIASSFLFKDVKFAVDDIFSGDPTV